MATQTFSQRISLEGGEELLKQLQALGVAGEKAFAQLKAAVEKPNPALAQLSTASTQAQQAFARFGTSIPAVTNVLTPLTGSLGGVLGLFGALAGGGGVLAAVGALALFVKSSADSAVANARQATALGLTIEQMKVLGRAARTAGIDQDELTTALIRFSTRTAAEAQQQFSALAKLVEVLGERLQGKAFSDAGPLRLAGGMEQLRAQLGPVAQQLKAVFDSVATQGRPAPSLQAIQQQLVQMASATGKAGDDFRNLLREIGTPVSATNPLESLNQLVKQNEASFKALGISLLDEKGKAIDTFEAFLRLADKLKEMPDGFQKTAIAAALLSRGVGPELLVALKGGREGIDKIKEGLRAMGIAADDSKVKIGVQMKQAFFDLDDATVKLRGNLLLSFGPALTQAISTVAASVTLFGSAANSTFGKIIQSALNPLAGLVDLVDRLKVAFDAFASTAIGQRIIDAIKGVPAAVVDLWNTIASDVSAAIEKIVGFFAQLPQRISSVVAGLSGLLTQPFRTALDSISGIVDQIVAFFRRIIAGASEARDAIVDIGSGGDDVTDVGGFAGGGHVRGPGTTTSDSIFARLSRGEFVVNAAAVAALIRRHGAGIMSAINRGFVPGFAAGGFADAFALPRFATGGSVDFSGAGGGGLHPVTIDMGGGRSVGGLFAPPDVVGRLKREAIHAQVSSSGKSPSWVR